jgi:hypothetical protein
LRLPPEIRNKIWAFAVQVDLVYNWQSYGPRLDLPFGFAVARKTGGVIDDNNCQPRQSSAFHLPEVCRQIYAEVGTLAYSTNTFLVRFNSAFSMHWVKHLIPAQRDAITSVELGGFMSYWPGYADSRKSLRNIGLRNLTHCYVSLYWSESLNEHYNDLFFDIEGTEDERTAVIQQRVEAAEGKDMIVVIQEGVSSETDAP